MLRVPAITTVFVISLFGQSDIYFSPSFDLEVARTGMETISRNDLEAHLSFLASDITEGRATGEPGLAIAGEYIALSRITINQAQKDLEIGYQHQEQMVTNLFTQL